MTAIQDLWICTNLCLPLYIPTRCARVREKKAVNMLLQIYNYFINHVDEMPEEYINIANEDGIERAVCDYIAGMSDTYALKIFNSFLCLCFGMTD